MIDQREIEKKLNALTNPPKRTIKSYYIRAAVAIAALAVAPFTAHYIDTKLFPVVSDAHALIFEASAPDQTAVAVIYNKNRTCQIISADFFLNGAAIRMIQAEGGLPLVQRPIGKNRSRTFVLSVPRETFINDGVIQFVHRCHPLWLHQRIIFQ
jgi:hypothetical protein